jgi:hypothetical protein
VLKVTQLWPNLKGWEIRSEGGCLKGASPFYFREGEMRIIDVSAGKRAVWFNKHHPDALYIDIRPEVQPDVVCDSRELPITTPNIPDWTSYFDLAVFDPPHVNFGRNAELSYTYGYHTTEEIRDIITRTATQLHRVLKPDGMLSFKWNDHDQKLDKVIALMPQFEPLVGATTSMRTKHASTTFWVLLRNRK